MRFTPTKKISELPALSPATLDTTFVVGISGSTTYKISINQLTSSLDTTFATDLVTTALSNSLNSKLSTSSYSSDSASFNSRIISGSAVAGTISGSSQISALGFVTGSYTTINSFNSLTQSFNSISQSFNVISGSVGTVNFTTLATTGSNTFIGNQNITGSLKVSGSISVVGDLTINGTSYTAATSGTSGAKGNQGNQGPQGVNGTAGSSGVQGPQGPTGPQGNQGIDGTTGSQGPTGPQGNQGTVGSSGAQGPQGVQGSNGVVGNNGTSGTSGFSIVSGSFATTSSLSIVSASAWGAFQSASSYSGSLQTSITTLSSSVDSRLDTLESSIITGSVNYTQVLGDRRTGINAIGISIISGSITTTGNPVQIMVTGDANPQGGSSFGRLQIYRDGNPIGNIVQVENSTNLNVPYCLNIIDTPSAGTYVYSMRTVSSFSGNFDFGEVTGPLLTAVELKTNTNLPSTNNTFTGTNTFRGSVSMLSTTALQIGTGSGDEGGEILLAKPQTNNSLTGSGITIDSYQDRLRIFEQGGNARGVYIDLSKTPAGNAGELLWKTSGMVAAGTFVTLDNLKCTITASGNRGLSIGAVSTTFEADVSGWYAVPGGSGGGSSNNVTYTTTASNSAFGWNLLAHGDSVQLNLRDKTNNRFYRINMMIGASYISNFISIERLF